MRIGKPNGLSSIRLDGTSIRQLGGTIISTDYYELDPAAFGGNYLSVQNISGCRVSKNSSTQITVAPGTLSIPDTLSRHHQCYFVGSTASLSTIKFTGTPSVGANQTWYIFLVRNEGDGVLSLAADSSSTGATNPDATSGVRLLGLLTTDGSGNIDKVFQHNQPDTCRVTNSATISIPTSTLTTVDWDTERHDIGGLHSTSTNTSRITIQKGGQYFVELSVQFAAESAGNTIKYARIVVNGSNQVAGQVARSLGGGTASQTISCCAMPYLQASDYIEAQVFQNTGASLNLLTTADVSNFGATLMEFN